MNLMPESVTRTIGRSVLKTKANSPHILFVGGVIGVVAAGVMACRATLKLDETLDEVRGNLEKVRGNHAVQTTDEQSQKAYIRDLGEVYGRTAFKMVRLYGPSVIVGTVSVSALTGSHIQLTRRNSALTFTVAAVTKAYEEYRERVREELGEEKELEFHRSLAKTDVEIDGKKQEMQYVNNNLFSPYARCFDATVPQFQKNFEHNRVFIQCQEAYANHQLRARGHVLLNDVYDSLGFERTKAGCVVGWIWNTEQGDGYIDFGLFEALRNQDGNEPALWLDFNVDGVIYDKI